MFESQGASEWRISFDDDVVGSTEASYIFAGIEGVNFYLVHCWWNARFRVEEFLKLLACQVSV